jgi:2-oxoglutarate dehydrogenase E2 component (dihydrolipoamide succinyltransferase)
MATEVVMPKLGESVVEGTVSRWLKQEGETIAEFEPLLEVSSDKVDSEIPSPAGGVLLKIYVPEGETVTAGTLLALIGQPGEVVPAGPADLPEAVSESGVPEAAASAGMRGGNGGTRISPVVARIAAEHQVDISRIKGTGIGGRVTKKDILAYIEERGKTAPPEELPPWERPGSGDLFKPTDDLYKPAPGQDGQPAAVAPAPLEGEIVPLSRMRRLIAEHMVASKRTAPHVTTVFEADMSAVAAHRQANLDALAARGINLTYTAYFVAAAAHALRLHPIVNSRWTEEGLLLQPEVAIGIAVAVGDGLIVPVIHRADELALPGLARQINDLAARARAGQLKPDEVQGGTFTITNHGVSGSLFATPIINQPQTAILGVGAIQKRVVVLDNDAIAVRPMVYLTLTFDHRVLDGAAADRFMADIKRKLEGWE